MFFETRIQNLPGALYRSTTAGGEVISASTAMLSLLIGVFSVDAVSTESVFLQIRPEDTGDYDVSNVQKHVNTQVPIHHQCRPGGLKRKGCMFNAKPSAIQ